MRRSARCDSSDQARMHNRWPVGSARGFFLGSGLLRSGALLPFERRKRTTETLFFFFFLISQGWISASLASANARTTPHARTHALKASCTRSVYINVCHRASTVSFPRRQQREAAPEALITASQERTRALARGPRSKGLSKKTKPSSSMPRRY